MFVGMTAPLHQLRLEFENQGMITLSHRREFMPRCGTKPGRCCEPSASRIARTGNCTQNPEPLLGCRRIEHTLPTDDHRRDSGSSQDVPRHDRTLVRRNQNAEVTQTKISDRIPICDARVVDHPFNFIRQLSKRNSFSSVSRFIALKIKSPKRDWR